MSNLTVTLPDDVVSSLKNIAFTYNKSTDEILSDLLQVYINTFRDMHKEV